MEQYFQDFPGNDDNGGHRLIDYSVLDQQDHNTKPLISLYVGYSFQPVAAHFTRLVAGWCELSRPITIWNF